MPLDLDAVLVCLDTLALLCFVRPLRYPSAVLDILTLSVQHFDAQPALDVHEVSFLVIGTSAATRRAAGLDQCFYSAHLRGARGLHAIAA